MKEINKEEFELRSKINNLKENLNFINGKLDICRFNVLNVIVSTKYAKECEFSNELFKDIGELIEEINKNLELILKGLNIKFGDTIRNVNS